MNPAAPNTVKYRPEIDGLRALAVLMVVIVHAFPSKLPGGFIGVDVFFVISGFLIGSIILGQLQTEKFSILEFYIRRANRIFPALVLVLSSCLVFGWFALFDDEYKSLGRSTAAGAGFVANVNLYLEVGYWDVASKLKPLLHLWSLGVEEQFYIVFPGLLWLCWKRKFNFLTVLLVVSVVSGLWMRQTMMSTNHSAAFYLPFHRAWELLAGAILAWLHLQAKGERPRWVSQINQLLFRAIYQSQHPQAPNSTYLINNVAACLGLTMILFAAFALNEKIPFPSKWALLPVLGACLLIAAGNGAWLNQKVFANRVAVYIGLISFPLYLWHWPLLSFAHILTGAEAGPKMRNLALVLSFILAAATYHGLEKPLRNSQLSAAKRALLLSLGLFIVGAVGFGIHHMHGLPLRAINQLKSADLFNIRRPPVAKNDKNVCFKALPNNFKLQIQNGLQEGTQVHCQARRIENVSMAMLGDSNAGHFAYDLHQRFGESLLTIHSAGQPYLRDFMHTAESQAILDFVLKQPHINTVVLSHLGTELLQDVTPSLSRKPYIARPEYFAALKRTISGFQSAGKRVIFVSAIPMLDFDPKACQARPFAPSKTQQRCGIPRSEIAQTHVFYLAALAQLRKEMPQLDIIDAMDSLCDKEMCYAKRDGKILYSDFKHVNFIGSEFITTPLIKLIEQKKSMGSDSIDPKG